MQQYDDAVDRLAKQLAALPYEWKEASSDGDNSPINNTYCTSSDFFDSGDYWSKNDFTPSSANIYGRYTDTPNSWPTSSGVSELSPTRYYSGTSTPNPTFFGSGQRSAVVDAADAPFPMTKEEVEEWDRLLKWPPPGPGYVCKICRQNNHFIQNCPRAPRREELKTPYQGHNKCFGEFSCTACQRDWTSFQSEAESGQVCRKCQAFIYPHKQFPLDKVPEGKLMQKKRGKGRTRR